MRVLLEETLGRDPTGAESHSSHFRPAGQPGSPCPQLAQGRLLPLILQPANTLLIPPRTSVLLRVPGSGIPKTKISTTEQNNHSYYQRLRPLATPRRRLSAVLWERCTFPGCPGFSGPDSPTGGGRRPVARASASRSRDEDRAPAGFGGRSAGSGDLRGRNRGSED